MGPRAAAVTRMSAHWFRLIISIAQIVEDFDYNQLIISDAVMNLADLPFARGQCLSLQLRFKLQ
jgi:hypothetical protein